LSETKASLANAQGVAARQCWLGVRAPPCADVAAPLQAASGSGALRLSQHPDTKPVSCQAALVEGDALGNACALAWRRRGTRLNLAYDQTLQSAPARGPDMRITAMPARPAPELSAAIVSHRRCAVYQRRG